MRRFSLLTSRWALSAAFVLLLTGCKRLDGDTVVEGRVVDRVTGTFIRGPVTVGVYRPGASGGGLGGGYALLEEHQTDRDGRFSFHINSDADQMILRATGGLGYETFWQEAPELRGGRNNKKLWLKAQSPAWVKIHVVNSRPQDTVGISFYGLADQSHISLWRPSSETVVGRISGNDSVRLTWVIYKSGVSDVSAFRSFYVPALERVPKSFTC